MRIRSLAALSLVFAVAACGDEPTSAGPTPVRPASILYDGSQGGNQDFFFLPPVAPSPVNHPEYNAGKFDGTRSTTVAACLVDAEPVADLLNGCVNSERHTYGTAQIGIDVTGQHYQVAVDTRHAFFVGNRTYRFTVLDGERELGFVDITLLDGSARNAKTLETVAMQDGRIIPLRFRVERPFRRYHVSDSDPHRVLKVGPEHDPDFALELPSGWLPANAPAVEVTIERMNDGVANPCTAIEPTLYKKADGDCWRVETSPQIFSIEQDLVVAFCPSIAPGEFGYDDQSMFKFDAPALLRRLASIPTQLVTCNEEETPGDITFRDADGFMGTLRWGASAFARGIGKAFGPNVAWALDAGYGGHMRSEDFSSEEEPVFSDFFWGVAPSLEAMRGSSGQTAAPGATIDVAVRLAAHHGDEHSTPFPGYKIEFLRADGSQLATAATGPDGVARIQWTLPTTPGDYAVTARVSGVYAIPNAVDITATVRTVVDYIGVTYGAESATVGSDDSAWIPPGASSVFVATPYVGQTPSTGQGCEFELPAVGDDAFVEVVNGSITSNSIAVRGLRESGSGWSLLTITCGSATRAVRIYVGDGGATM